VADELPEICPYEIERSNLYQVRKQASQYLCDLNTRVTIIENGPCCMVYTCVNADYTIRYDHEVVLVNSRLSPITITLRADPVKDDYTGVWDDGNYANVNNITIVRNGSTIDSREENAVINCRGGRFDFIYCEDIVPVPAYETSWTYTVDVSDQLVLTTRITGGSMDEIAQDDAAQTFGVGPNWTIEQVRWFFEDGPYFDDAAQTFSAEDGTLVQVRWFFEDGPYLDDAAQTFGVGPLWALETKLIAADTPDEELQLGAVIDDTCTMDVI
jgi:hypothetical protein